MSTESIGSYLKRHREAIAELKKARELSGDSPAMTMQLGYAYAMAGKAAEAKKMLAALARLARACGTTPETLDFAANKLKPRHEKQAVDMARPPAKLTQR